MPGVALAVNIDAAADPVGSVPTVSVFDPLVAKTPLAPLAGALKVTSVPATVVVIGQPLVLASATAIGLENEASSWAVWGSPETSVSVFGGLEGGHCVAPVERDPAG